MQFSKIFFALTAVASVTALPTEVTPAPTCPASHQEAKCCQDVKSSGGLGLGGLLGLGELIGLNCVNLAIGGCNNKVTCCTGSQAQSPVPLLGLINVVIDLSCTSIL